MARLPRVEDLEARRVEWAPALRQLRAAVLRSPLPWERAREALARDGWPVAFRFGGEEAEVRVGCSAVPARFGARLWWHCPCCGARRSVLFALRSRDVVALRCRGCLGLRYRARQCGTRLARQKHRAWAAGRRAARLWARLQRCRAGSQRWQATHAAWERALVEHEALEARIFGALTAQFGRLLGKACPLPRRQARYRRRRRGDG